MSRLGRAVCFTAGSVLALVAARIGWQIMWARAVDTAYGRRWDEHGDATPLVALIVSLVVLAICVAVVRAAI